MSGVRHMRTISQLTFETVIQFMVQISMLGWYATNSNGEEDQAVSMSALVVSIIIAALHFTLEIAQLNFEAKAVETSLSRYFIVCFNGRLGWTPFLENIMREFAN